MVFDGNDKARITTLIGRNDGEEFTILLPNTTLFSALSISERIRCLIENLDIESNGHSIKATVSMGVGFDENADQITTVVALGYIIEMNFKYSHRKLGTRKQDV